MTDFRGKRAWFSSNVAVKCKQIWANRGGELVEGVKDANFIFANTADGISWFFESNMFLQDGVLPFKSAWLLKTSQNILDFILRPKDLIENSEIWADVWAFTDQEDSMKILHLNDLRNTQRNKSKSSQMLRKRSPTILSSKDKNTRQVNQKCPKPARNTRKTLHRIFSDSDTCSDTESSSTAIDFGVEEEEMEIFPELQQDEAKKKKQKCPRPVKKTRKTVHKTCHNVDASSELDIPIHKDFRNDTEEKETDSCHELQDEDQPSPVYKRPMASLSKSLSLEDLEVPNHVFHSSMHDGFIHIEDLDIPAGLHLDDFSYEEANSEYQVYLKDCYKKN